MPAEQTTSKVSRRRAIVVVVTIAAVALTGCGGVSFSIGGVSVEEAATTLIENDLAELIDLGGLTASCADVEDPEVGTEFVCTAVTADGTTIEFLGVVDREDHIDVNTTNLLSAAAIPTVEAAGVEVINDAEGVSMPATAMECPEETIVVDPGQTQLVCLLTDPAGALWDVTYTLLGDGDFDLNWEPVVSP